MSTKAEMADEDDGWFKDLDERLKNISGQLEIITSMQLETEKRHVRNEERFAGIERRFSDIAQIFMDVHGSISALERIVRAHERRISDLEDRP
jgi:hypothetical protein